MHPFGFAGVFQSSACPPQGWRHPHDGGSTLLGVPYMQLGICVPGCAIQKPEAAVLLSPVSPACAGSCSWSLVLADDVMCWYPFSCTNSMLTNCEGNTSHHSMTLTAAPVAGKLPPFLALPGPLAGASGPLRSLLCLQHRGFHLPEPVTL